MNIKIEANFNFSVESIRYAPSGELCITLLSGDDGAGSKFLYTASLGSGRAEEHPSVDLAAYTRTFVDSRSIKEKSKDPYYQMLRFLMRYGDVTLDKVTTEYLQGFISSLKAHGLSPNTVRLYFQKLTCVLHNAYKEGLFDDRILQRVHREKRPKEKKCFLTEAELRKMARNRRRGSRDNLERMFLFSCLTGLRFGDVCGLRWKDVRRNGKHLHLEFRQHKTDTCESLPLCEGAEEMLRGMGRTGEFVFGKMSNQAANRKLRQWCRDSGIRKPVTYHTSRHTFCVLLLTKEVPLFTVQQLMCHSDIGTTNVYADLTNRSKAKALRRFPAIA